MADDPLTTSANTRLHAISEELHSINSEIIQNLELLLERDELVAKLIARCDGIALELDAIRLEIMNSSDE